MLLKKYSAKSSGKTGCRVQHTAQPWKTIGGRTAADKKCELGRPCRGAACKGISWGKAEYHKRAHGAIISLHAIELERCTKVKDGGERKNLGKVKATEP